MTYKVFVFAFVFLTCTSPVFAQNGNPRNVRAGSNPDGSSTGGSEIAAARTQEQWKALVEERKELAKRHDIVSWSKLVPDDVVWINDKGEFRTKAQMQEQNAASNPAKLLGSDIVDFRVIPFGDSVVLLYHLTQHSELNAIPFKNEYVAQETYSRLNGEWQLRVYQETSIPAKPALIAMDPKSLETYRGQYQVGPHDIVTVKSLGDRLMTAETNLPSAELLAEGDSTFWDGEEHIQFVRNNTGKVTGLIFYPAGQIVPAMRVIP